MQQLLENRKEDIKKICQAMKVQRLYAFGSVVSDHFREDSDIDFLIAFPDTLSVEEYTQNYFALHYQLSIGEAMNRIMKLDAGIRIENARQIVDTRNWVIHGYDKVDDVVIWGIVTIYLPKLKGEIENLLKEE